MIKNESDKFKLINFVRDMLFKSLIYMFTNDTIGFYLNYCYCIMLVIRIHDEDYFIIRNSMLFFFVKFHRVLNSLLIYLRTFRRLYFKTSN